MGLSWRRDIENGTAYTLDGMSDENSGKQGGAEEERIQQSKQSSDASSRVNEELQVEEPSDSRRIKRRNA